MKTFINHMQLLFRMFEKMSEDKLSHLNTTDAVSWLSLVKHYIKTDTIEVVVTTTCSEHCCHEIRARQYDFIKSIIIVIWIINVR